MEKCFVFYLKKKKKRENQRTSFTQRPTILTVVRYQNFVRINRKSIVMMTFMFYAISNIWQCGRSMWAYAPGVNINWYTCDKMGCIHFCAVASMCVFATEGNYAVALCLSLPVAITMEKNDINSNSSFFSVNFFLSKNSPFATGPVNKMAYWIRTKLI